VLSLIISRTVNAARKNEIETESDEQNEQAFMTSSDNSFTAQMEAQKQEEA
jgi:hypothetical protein